MCGWRFVAKEQFRDQTGALYSARFISAASVATAPVEEIRVGRNVAITAEDAAGTLPEISNDHDVGLVITHAGFDPCLPLAHIV